MQTNSGSENTGTASLSERIVCPRCGSEAINRYGKAPNGKQRFICLVCRRQFVLDARRLLGAERPNCPLCGRPMHVYGRRSHFVRYRCAGYPQCKGFLKVQRKETDAL